MQASDATEQAPANQPSAGRVVARNALYLTIAQVLTIPLAIALNALLARYVGAAELGYLYVAGTFSSFGLLFVEWGQQGALPALVVADRANARVLLGTSLGWRAGMGLLVGLVLNLLVYLLGYSRFQIWTVAIAFGVYVVNSMAGGSKDTIRGFERTDIPSVAHVGQQVLNLLVAVPVLLLGGRLLAVLGSQIIVALVTLLSLWWALRRMNVSSLAFGRDTLRSLLIAGTPFVFLDLAMVLQPVIDAAFVSKMAPPEVMGWYGVSRRLTGLLLLPATSLIGALYPTLCRLWLDDRAEFVRITRAALHGVAIMVVPVALGCALYPELGIGLFGPDFAPGKSNLRILALFVLLVYFTMPLGSAILAAGKRRAWSIVQSLCVGFSAVLDQPLVSWFQSHHGNGGVGVCLTAVISESAVIACGVALAPAGIFDRGLAKTLSLAAVAGAAMAGVAYLTRSITPFAAAPLAVIVYGGVLWLIGGIEPELLAAARGFFTRKFAKKR